VGGAKRGNCWSSWSPLMICTAYRKGLVSCKGWNIVGQYSCGCLVENIGAWWSTLLLSTLHVRCRHREHSSRLSRLSRHHPAYSSAPVWTAMSLDAGRSTNCTAQFSHFRRDKYCNNNVYLSSIRLGRFVIYFSPLFNTCKTKNCN